MPKLHKRVLVVTALVIWAFAGAELAGFVQTLLFRLRAEPAFAQGEGGVPVGAIFFIKSGACPTGYVEDTDLNGRTPVGTLDANGNVGGTGGSDNITPAGTNSAPTFTGSAWTPATVSWPAGVPTFTGNALTFTEILQHTHTVSVTDPGHTHNIASQTATTGGASSWEHGAIDTSSAATETLPSASATTGISASTANPGGSVASFQKTPTGTVAWPAGVPTLGGYTPSGSVAAPTFTGSQFDNRRAFIRLIACRKT